MFLNLSIVKFRVPVLHQQVLCYNAPTIRPMAGKFFIVFILLFSYFFFAPQALNQTIAKKHCTAQKPGSAPILTSAVAGENSVTLTWVEAQDPVTYYLVAYGRSETDIEYGNPNVGGKGTTTYTVGELVRGVKYYFRIRGVNNCKPGKFSNKLSAIPGFRKSVAHTPNLSIYKTVQGASISAIPTIEARIDIPVPLVIANEESSRCLTCVSWQLLIVEAILLISYLYLAGKVTFLRQIFSIAIPIAMYILFWKINGECSINTFICKYFLELNVIIFVVIVVVYKNKYINSKTNLLERFFKKTTKKK